MLNSTLSRCLFGFPIFFYMVFAVHSQLQSSRHLSIGTTVFFQGLGATVLSLLRQNYRCKKADTSNTNSNLWPAKGKEKDIFSTFISIKNRLKARFRDTKIMQKRK
jgi:hypothetical protein